MISYKGKLAVTVAIPVFAQFLASIDLVGMGIELAALYKVALTFTPPSVFGIGQILAAISAALQGGFVPPAIGFQADLLAKYGLLKAKYDLLIKLQSLLASGSLRVYEYEGAAGSFGSELTSTLSGDEASGGIAPTQQTFAVLLVAEAGTAGATTLKTLRAGA